MDRANRRRLNRYGQAVCSVLLAFGAVYRFHSQLMPVAVRAQQPELENLTALAIVERAVKAAGGEAWARPKTLQLRGDATFYWQGERREEIHVPVYRMWRIYPSESDAAHQANGKVRFDAFIGEKLYFQIAFDGRNTYAEYSPEAERDRESSRWENAFGFGILRFARDPAFTLLRMADDQIEGHDCYFVRVIDPKKNVTDFGIDRRDFAIRSVGFKTPRGFHLRIYSDFKWHRNPRFRQPTRVRLYYDGVKWTDIRWREFEVNRPIADEVFTLKKTGER
jgi:hypothetical protein